MATFGVIEVKPVGFCILPEDAAMQQLKYFSPFFLAVLLVPMPGLRVHAHPMLASVQTAPQDLPMM